jgi:ADP-ribosylglycohydrolase
MDHRVLSCITHQAMADASVSDGVNWSYETDQSILVIRTISDVNSDNYRIAFSNRLHEWHKNKKDKLTCDGSGPADSGALLRAGIIGALMDDEEKIIKAATEITMATHVDPRCIAASVFLARLIFKLTNYVGFSRASSNIWTLIKSVSSAYIDDILKPVYDGTYHPQIANASIDTVLPLSIWYLLRVVYTGLSFEQALSEISNLNGVNPAVFGLLVGAYKMRARTFRVKDLTTLMLK